MGAFDWREPIQRQEFTPADLVNQMNLVDTIAATAPSRLVGGQVASNPPSMVVARTSARDYGTKTDGVTDNLTAFTAISAAANATSGMTIDFPDGAYAYSGGLAFTKPTTIQGGYGAIMNYTGSGIAVKMGPDGLVLGTYDPNPYQVDGFTFTGGASSTQGIYFNWFITSPKVRGTYFKNFGSPTGYAIFGQGQNWDFRISQIKMYASDTAVHNGIRGNGIAVDGTTSDQGQSLMTVSDSLMTNQATATGQVVGIYTNGAFSRIINNKIEGYAPCIWVGCNSGSSGSGTKIAHCTMEVVRGSLPGFMFGEASGPYAGVFNADIIVEDSYVNVHNTDFGTTAHFMGPAGASSGLQNARINNNMSLNQTAGQPIVVLNNIASQTGNEANGNRQGTAYPDLPPKPMHTAGGNISAWGGTNGEASTFWNGADATNTLIVKSGATAAQTSMVQLQDFNGNSIGSIEGTTVSNRLTLKGPGGTNVLQAYSDGRAGFITGIDGDSGGHKAKRLTTGSINANTDSPVTVTWGTAFADANYTVVATVVDATAAAASLKVIHIDSLVAASCVVRVRNDSAGALTGTLHVIAVHD